MYAIIESGSKQHRVEKGACIDVELIDAQVNETVDFENVLVVNDGEKMHFGQPKAQFLVQGTVIEQEIKGPKIVAYKYKRRKNYHCKKGHRQKYSRVKITEIKSL